MNQAQSYRGMNPQRGTRRTVVIPAFSASAPTWSGVSEIIQRYTVSISNDFSFKLPIAIPNETFVAAVSWTTSGITYRFKLSDAGVLYYPVYDGERLNKDIYFEIWSVAGQSIASISTGWSLETSGLVLPTIQTDISDNYESVTAVLV